MHHGIDEHDEHDDCSSSSTTITTPRRRNSTLPKSTPPPERVKQEKPLPTRIMREQLALLMALWAEVKPDSHQQQLQAQSAIDRYNGNDNIIPVENTGAVLLDSNNMIQYVVGSAFTHSAAILCTQYPTICQRGTICLSKLPCSLCLKLMIQCGVSRIVVPKRSRLIPLDDHKECESYKLQDDDDTRSEKNRKDWIRELLLPSQTAIHQVGLPEREMNYLTKMMEDPPTDVAVWLMGVAVLASSRSEDWDIAVGAVLAEYDPVTNTGNIFGVGYNGVKKKSLLHDYPQYSQNKGFYSIHAEQNALMFRSRYDVRNLCIFTTHSPCFQCSGILRQAQIHTYYLELYRGGNTILEDEHKQLLYNETLAHVMEQIQSEVAIRREMIVQTFDLQQNDC
jgi:deoxycytidylate deaminase